MGQVASEHTGFRKTDDRHDAFLPTDELRQALQHALTTEKTRELTDDDLAQMDATVSKYLEQQLKLNAERAQGEAQSPVSTPPAWYRTWWFQVATGMAALATAGFYFWH